ncbi:hypothetical protein AX15_004455 [Amanita polypyramis BW_CC]|nr:hypothetical protein AX15_004455 [Amanita polypyramis BW_CC]
MGGDGKLTLTATLIRLYWISGQRCFVHLSILNETKKAVASVTLTLLRNTVVFRPLPRLEALPFGKAWYNLDPDACQTATTTKIIAESTLEAGDRATRGHASAKGWWTGVPPRKRLDLSHSIVIPPGEVSLARSRFLEVEYILKVSLCVGTLLSSDMQVSLPIRLVNFLSVDPYINSVLDPASRNNSVCGETSHSYAPDTDARALHGVQGSSCNPPLGSDDPESQGTSIDGTVILDDGDDDDDNYSEYLDSILLGDSSRADGSEEVLQRTVTSARIDQTYGERAPRFSDLYYLCVQEKRAAGEGLEPENQPNVTREETLSSEYDDDNFKSCLDRVSEFKSSLGTSKRVQNSGTKETGIPETARPDYQNIEIPGQLVSSFALRVEEKLQAAQRDASRPTVCSIETTCSGALSVDGLLSEVASDSQKTTDKHVFYKAYKDLQTDDELKESATQDQVQLRQSEVCGKAGSVKSKILELEKRLAATTLQ